MPSLDGLKTKIFLDTADIEQIIAHRDNPLVAGFTTNPTLMRKAGVTNYREHAKRILDAVGKRPVSFEVIADDLVTMERQARIIADWGSNVYVKIPITNSTAQPALPIIYALHRGGVAVNVTAVMTLQQIKSLGPMFTMNTKAIVSVFAGRIADTGHDPKLTVMAAVTFFERYPNVEIISASPRELLNIFDAARVGCHIITLTPDVLTKLPIVGKDLTDYSRETCAMFYRDAVASGLTL